ncbi:hypothetical protein BDY21DRAFT_378109 [Lineolata rhizophorae]|uniref:Postreplication repair E3 ubiquitin-protein ligase RAD18 n=1 Tax=Lineolata rhizophorae TaxID=578093 RepID=A0A6A6P5B8_9PEZI|nr:hypothetical protein BDY21DRAFT_378109 [Lineolata rhizophorae]
MSAGMSGEGGDGGGGGGGGGGASHPQPHLSDPTDFLSTAIPGLTRLDSAVRCEVCKDFFTTPMLTSCAHAFCSLCIRRALSADGRCPKCRAPDQASKLRRCDALVAVVEGWKGCRAEVLGRAGTEEVEARRGVKRKVGDVAGEEDREGVGRRTRSQAKKTAVGTMERPGEKDPDNAVVDLVQDTEDEDDGEYRPEPDDGLVGCPVCGKRMKEELVFSHLDRCDGEPERHKSAQPTKRTAGQQFRSATTAIASKPSSHPHHLPARPSMPRAPSEDPTRISQLQYNLLSETQLRKKMRELGIPVHGTKQTLVRRHTEWVNLWNANCDADAARRRSKRELLNDLRTWEGCQDGGGGGSGGGRQNGGLVVGPISAGGGVGANAGYGSAGPQATTAAAMMASGVMKKDFDGRGWARANRDQFSDLIESARRTRDKALEKREKRTESMSDGSTPNAEGSGDHKPRPREEVGAQRNNGEEMDLDDVDQPEGQQSNQQSPSKPYAGNDHALNVIKSKVAASSEVGGASDPYVPPAGDGGEPQETVFAHIGRGDSNVPSSADDGPTLKKKPMFALPAEPFQDTDGDPAPTAVQ